MRESEREFSVIERVLLRDSANERECLKKRQVVLVRETESVLGSVSECKIERGR